MKQIITKTIEINVKVKNLDLLTAYVLSEFREHDIINNVTWKKQYAFNEKYQANLQDSISFYTSPKFEQLVEDCISKSMIKLEKDMEDDFN